MLWGREYNGLKITLEPEQLIVVDVVALSVSGEMVYSDIVPGPISLLRCISRPASGETSTAPSSRAVDVIDSVCSPQLSPP
ncbi:MAG: hypothetical protein KBI48_05880 [Deltaproteobacteria bacterium]|jgi:hypothetical protein|nr:hypothetical protein [Deltaproteobacteria bacterium]